VAWQAACRVFFFLGGAERGTPSPCDRALALLGPAWPMTPATNPPRQALLLPTRSNPIKPHHTTRPGIGFGWPMEGKQLWSTRDKDLISQFLLHHTDRHTQIPPGPKLCHAAPPEAGGRVTRSLIRPASQPATWQRRSRSTLACMESAIGRMGWMHEFPASGMCAVCCATGNGWGWG
jgi:hypothetical protein